MKRTVFLTFFLLTWLTTSLQANTPVLSEKARMSMLTASPGEELYTAFGHSALLVTDPVNRIDEVYNWGTFDFNTPNFYLKFMQGRLLYQLTVVPLHVFMRDYQRAGRAVYEQKLHLDPAEMQRIYGFLQYNRQPENIHYLYDFFYDNCATRIRDLVDQQLEVDWGPDPHPHRERSFRDMVKPYVANRPWLSMGMDMILGLPSDKIASPHHYMFLPDEMFIAFQQARHSDGRLLVYGYTELLADRQESRQATWIKPVWAFAVLLVIAVILSRLKTTWFWYLGRLYFVVLALLGLIIFFMWFLSDHYATAINLNLLWTLPTHIYFAFYLGKARQPILSQYYFKAVLLINLVLILGWPLNPQGFHIAFLPMITLAAYFAFANLRTNSLSHPTSSVKQ